MTIDTDGVLWTRRATLGALAAAGLAPALAAWGDQGFPGDALRAYARAVGADPQVAALGRAAADGRDVDALEAGLRARLPGARDEAGWRAGLLEAARADLARGDRVTHAGRRLTRVEADFLGLAARLQPAA